MDDKLDLQADVFPTRIWKTEEQYAKTFDRLSKKAEEHQAKGLIRMDLPLAVAMAQIFVQHEDQWAAATARSYRAALLWGFKQHQMESTEQAIAVLKREGEDPAVRQERLECMQALRRKRRRSKPRCSQKKAKRFPIEDVKPLIEALSASRSKWASAAAHYFLAAFHTGLRPTEWVNATLIFADGKPALRVGNAKNTNGRSHGTYRTLLLDELPESDLAVIKEHMRMLRPYAEEGRFVRYYDACRQLIYDVANRVYSKKRNRPALYTARHMFAALAKKNYDRVQVAAMMGHASIDTAGEHYAPSWSASGSSRVKPSEEDVEAVRSLNPTVDKPEPDKD